MSAGHNQVVLKTATLNMGKSRIRVNFEKRLLLHKLETGNLECAIDIFVDLYEIDETALLRKSVTYFNV